MREPDEASGSLSQKWVFALASLLAVAALGVLAVAGGADSTGFTENLPDAAAPSPSERAADVSSSSQIGQTEPIARTSRSERLTDALALPDTRAAEAPAEGEEEPLEILKYRVTWTAARPVPDEVPPVSAPKLEPGPVSLPASYEAAPAVTLARAAVPSGPGVSDGSDEIHSERVVRGIVKRGEESDAAEAERLRFRPGSEAARNAEGGGPSIGESFIPTIGLVGQPGGADCDTPGGTILPVGRGVSGFTGVAQRPGLRGAFRGGGGGPAAVNRKGPGRRF